MYTGELPAATVDQHAAEFLSLSREYMLEELFHISEASCIRQISVETVKSYLLLAHIHESKPLEQACFDFISQNAARTLTNPDVVALANENPGLWDKLSKAVSPETNNHGDKCGRGGMEK